MAVGKGAVRLFLAAIITDKSLGKARQAIVLSNVNTITFIVFIENSPFDKLVLIILRVRQNLCNRLKAKF